MKINNQRELIHVTAQFLLDQIPEGSNAVKDDFDPALYSLQSMLLVSQYMEEIKDVSNRFFEAFEQVEHSSISTQEFRKIVAELVEATR